MAAGTLVTAPSAELAAYCRWRHIRKLSLFGSATRDDFCAGSDVDVLVEFEANHVPGLIGLGSIALELSTMFGGRTVDLHTPNSLHEDFRQQVLADAEVCFDGQQG